MNHNMFTKGFSSPLSQSIQEINIDNIDNHSHPTRKKKNGYLQKTQAFNTTNQLIQCSNIIPHSPLNNDTKTSQCLLLANKEMITKKDNDKGLMTGSQNEYLNPEHPIHNSGPSNYDNYNNYITTNQEYWNYVTNSLLNNQFHSYGVNLSENNELPKYFNPQNCLKMTSKERVAQWIDKIPIWEFSNDCWDNNLFNNEYTLDWEEREFEFTDHDLNTAYIHTYLPSDMSMEEILFLQSQKIDSLVRRMYTQEIELKPVHLSNDIEATNLEI